MDDSRALRIAGWAGLDAGGERRQGDALLLERVGGGVALARVRAIAKTGVDFISVGALTHSARAVDIGLDFESK